MSAVTQPTLMDVQYLFNSSGLWVAFRRGEYIFNTEGDWIGWLPWNGSEAVDRDGNYIGTIYPEDRFYKVITRQDKGYPGYPGYPDSPGYPGYPGFRGKASLPWDTEDINEPALVA